MRRGWILPVAELPELSAKKLIAPFSVAPNPLAFSFHFLILDPTRFFGAGSPPPFASFP